VAKEVVHRLELAKDHRQLGSHEEDLCQLLKLLSLSSLQRMVARQEARILWLSDGDGPTMFFHSQANGRHHKNHIHNLLHEGQTITSEEDKAAVAFQFYFSLMGMPATRTNSIALEELGLAHLQLDELGNRFTEEEVWRVVRRLPLDKASGRWLHFQVPTGSLGNHKTRLDVCLGCLLAP
jgi:hypothetical protein